MLVLRPGALGDTLIAVPALRALRRRGFSDVTLAAHAGAARLLASAGEVALGIAFDDSSLRWLFTPDHAPAEQVLAWVNPEAMPALKHALLVAPSRPADAAAHCGTYLVDSLAGLGVDRFLDERPLGIASIDSDEVLVHPGSGSTAKNWPAARFAETIRALESPVRLIVGEADGAAARSLETILGRALPRLEHTPLEHLAARLAGCRAYLGNDSGVSHLAGLSGARTLVLFGPTSATAWRPFGRDVHTPGFDTPPGQIAELLLGAGAPRGA
ncbi:MAG: glycosyltransferase family 9 protein [Chloroflexota bacterium]